jgi:hypothetical protein
VISAAEKALIVGLSTPGRLLLVAYKLAGVVHTERSTLSRQVQAAERAARFVAWADYA